ncbi:MAG: hypothetical protein HJJLKODD_02227 [Phycisphaerae bacterium]|nr:hypothetical protein [Phycisphaerae bacterium]
MLRRWSLSARIGLFLFTSLLVMGTLCALVALYQHQAKVQKDFERHVRCVAELCRTILEQPAGGEHWGLLRSVLQTGWRDGNWSDAGLINERKVLVSAQVEHEGVEAEFALNRPGLLDLLAAQKADDRPLIHVDSSTARLEAIIAYNGPSSSQEQYLYIYRNTSFWSGDHWRVFWRSWQLGLLLAVAAAVAGSLWLRKNMLQPMQRWQKHIRQHGLKEGHSTRLLGELERLAKSVAGAARQLLTEERQVQSDLEGELNRLNKETHLQHNLLQQLMQDLKVSMAGILGHAELLINGDPKPADRINYIRAIQKDARRMSRLAHQLAEALQFIGRQNDPEELEAAMAQLHLIVQQLQDGTNSMPDLSDTAFGQRVVFEPAKNMAAASDSTTVTEESPAPIRSRMSGNVLLVGRRDSATRDLLRELGEIGIQTMWVPDEFASRKELSEGGYDLIVVSMMRQDRYTLELPAKLRCWAPVMPLVALVPEAQRGEGEQCRQLGCDEYIYTPITRRALVATLGKYLAFWPINQES